MERDEFDKKMSDLKREFEINKKNLNIEYALSKAKFKVDDIIRCTKTETTIKVGAVKVYIAMDGIPEPVYWGYVLKKDLTPKKNGETHSIFGNNDVIKIQ